MLKAIAKKVLPQPVWAFLRSQRIQQNKNSFQNKIRSGVYCGHKLSVSLEDPLASGWYSQDWKNLKEIDFLKSYRLKTGAKVFDLGAHQSVVAMVIAKEVGPQGHVLAVEANKHNHRVGEKNKELNHLKQLTLIHGAVAEKAGTIDFSDDFNGAVKNKKTTSLSTSVLAFSIDDLIKDHFTPDVIFMDIEGFESHALKGAKNALQGPTDWFIEVHGPERIGRFGGSVEEVISPFLAGDYELFMAPDDGDFIPFDQKSPLLKDRFFLIAHKK